MPLHFAETSANRLTNDAGDAVTGTAEYKVCAVQVEPIPESLLHLWASLPVEGQ
ncbi:MAG: hypothetical protein ACYSUF_00755 [Planctomycetota bacterium]|jgi:formate dehydrogenase major subunit/formate dehydrogenase alpha subunit